MRNPGKRSTVRPAAHSGGAGHVMRGCPMVLGGVHNVERKGDAESVGMLRRAFLSTDGVAATGRLTLSLHKMVHRPFHPPQRGKRWNAPSMEPYAIGGMRGYARAHTHSAPWTAGRRHHVIPPKARGEDHHFDSRRGSPCLDWCWLRKNYSPWTPLPTGGSRRDPRFPRRRFHSNPARGQYPIR